MVTGHAHHHRTHYTSSVIVPRYSHWLLFIALSTMLLLYRNISLFYTVLHVPVDFVDNVDFSVICGHVCIASVHSFSWAIR